MYLIKEKIAPEFQSQDFELNIEAISLRSKKFEINTNMYKIGVVIDGSIELMYRDKVKELKKEDVFLRKEINNSTKLYIPPFIVLIFLIRTMLIKGKR